MDETEYLSQGKNGEILRESINQKTKVMEKENGYGEFPYKPPKGKIWKTNSYSEWVLVEDPDLYDAEGYKRSMKRTDITPKKKKRKKRHKKH